MSKYARTPLGIVFLWGVRLCLLLTLLAIWMDPTTSKEGWQEEYPKKNIMITLDISKSMKSDDVFPNRIEKAKEVLERFLREETPHRIGYSIFAGRTFVMSPLSEDRDGIRSLIQTTSTDTLDQSQPDTSGTNIGDALLLANDSFETASSTENIIILVTDGRANMGISPDLALEEIKKTDTSIYTIAIGTSSGKVLSYMEDGMRKYFYDERGNTILADIDETILRKIAEETGGRYFHALDAVSLEEAFDEIGSIVKGTPLRKYEISEYSLVPLLFGMLLLLFFLEVSLEYVLIRKYKFL